MDPGLVTVAFVDVERSTELLTRVGDVEGVATIDGLLSTVRERIEPYGGREVKSLGDGLMVVFGAPRQAVAFAVAVQCALLGRLPRLRIGVNTGEALGSTDDPVGEAVNAAARIAAKASGGEVLVSDVVRQLVGSMPGVRFVDRGRSRLKGFPERWRLFAVSGSEAAPEPAAVFGRDTELAEVDWLLAGLAKGNGRVLVFEGEAGIGKTHLVGAAGSRAAVMGALVVAGGADELERDRPGRILLGLANALDISLAALLDIDDSGGSRGFALIEAVVDAVENAAALRPVVVVVEDLHWADELSLRGIAALGRRLAPLPVALVATMRPSPRPPLLGAVLEVLRDAGARHVRVGSLDELAVGSLVASITGAAPGSTLVSRLSGAAGNPLFVIELLRALDEDGTLRVQGGVAETDESALPASLRETVVRRLSALPSDTVEVLRLASLLGGEFALTDLATIAGRSVVDVAARLREALDAAVLAGEGDVLSFRHDLIREAVYDDIAPAIRRDLHAAAGRALGAAGAPVVQVARQFALGARPGDVAAVEWLERAAQEALALDPGVAVALFERALAFAPDAWAGRARIEVALVEPLAMCGRVDDARALAAAMLDRGVTPRDEFAVRVGLAAVLGYAGDMAGSAMECEAAGAVPGAPPGEAQGMRCVAASLSMLGGRPPEQVAGVAEATLEYAATSGDDHLACIAHQALATVAGAQGRYDAAFDHARTARQLLDARRDPSIGWLVPHVWEAFFLLYLDRFEEGMNTSAKARQRAERRGQLGVLPLIHAGPSSTYFFAGRWDDALLELEAWLAEATETGNEGLTSMSHALLAKMAIGRGDLLDAETQLAAGQQVLGAGGNLVGVDLLFWAQAELLESRGEPDAALVVLQTVWEQTANIRYLIQYRNLGPDLVRLARDQGDIERARAVTAEMEHAVGRSTASSVAAAALRSRGLLGRDADLLVQAASRYRETPRRLELAAVCEEAADALSAAGRDREAIDALEEAATVYLETGADAYAARVDFALRAHGVRRRRRGPTRATHGWESLSPNERKIVELVAQGLSNPQIGARLYISRRTVETHLSHVFHKLDVSSRAQVAAAAAGRL